MAEGCMQSNSDQFGKDLTIDWDVDLIFNHITDGNVAYERKRLSWHNSYEQLKKTIESIFQQCGKWWSPGGSTKRFDSGKSDFTTIW